MLGLYKKIKKVSGVETSSLERVSGGFLSENYCIIDRDSKIFLKKYRFDTSKKIREIHSSQNYFAERGIPVILPILLLNGETFFEYKNYYYALFPFVDGKQLEGEDLTDMAITSLGKTLGQIHLLGKNSKLEINNFFKKEDRNKTLKKIESILNEINKKDFLSNFDKLALDNIEVKKKLILSNKLTFENIGLSRNYLIHGDYLPQNVFFDKDDVVKYVFDFEKTDYSPRTYELFRSMFYAFLTKSTEQKDLERAKRYFEAYSSIYPISKNEVKRGLQLFFLKSIHMFWVTSEHYLKNNDKVDHFLLDDCKRIKYLSENLEGLIRFLTE